MIQTKLKLWSGIGAAAFMAACGQTNAPAPPAEPVIPAASGEAAIGEGGGEGGGGALSVYAGLSGDQRTALHLQHLKGFVLIAERVAQSDPAAAAILVQQGKLEAYDTAPAEFGALDIAAINAAGDAARAPAEIRQTLQRAGSALDAARNALPVNHADLAVRMGDLTVALYRNATLDPAAIDPIEYQHAYGAALGARDALVAGEAALKRQDAAAYAESLAEIDRLIALFPSTTAPANPPSYQDVLRQSSRLRLALSAYL